MWCEWCQSCALFSGYAHGYNSICSYKWLGGTGDLSKPWEDAEHPGDTVNFWPPRKENRVALGWFFPQSFGRKCAVWYDHIFCNFCTVVTGLLGNVCASAVMRVMLGGNLFGSARCGLVCAFCRGEWCWETWHSRWSVEFLGFLWLCCLSGMCSSQI